MFARVRLASAIGGVLTIWRARLRLWRGDAEGASRLLVPFVGRRPDSFAGWVHLARASLALGDLPRFRGAIGRAHDLAPDAFARGATRWFGPAMAGVGAVLGGSAERTIGSLEPPALRAHAPVESDVEGAGASSDASGAPRTPPRVSPSAFPLGDCRDLDEYARFQAMPPITAAERHAVDWDAVADDLVDG